MENINVKTFPTGRSPKGKFFFGENANKLCKDRQKDVQIGNESDFDQLYGTMMSYEYKHRGIFRTCGIDFGVATTSETTIGLLVTCLDNLYCETPTN